MNDYYYDLFKHLEELRDRVSRLIEGAELLEQDIETEKEKIEKAYEKVKRKNEKENR